MNIGEESEREYVFEPIPATPVTEPVPVQEPEPAEPEYADA